MLAESFVACDPDGEVDLDRTELESGLKVGRDDVPPVAGVESPGLVPPDEPPGDEPPDGSPLELVEAPTVVEGTEMLADATGDVTDALAPTVAATAEPPTCRLVSAVAPTSTPSDGAETPTETFVPGVG